MSKTTQVFLIFLLSLLQYVSSVEVLVNGKRVTVDNIPDRMFISKDPVKNKLQQLSEKLGFCSNSFQYEKIDEFIIGRLTLPNLKIGDTVKVQFFHKDIDLNMTFNGSLLPDESSQEIISKLQNGQPITYRVDFPLAQKIPELEMILINDDEFCGTTFALHEEKLILQHTLKNIGKSVPVFKGNVNIPHFVKASTCGVDDTGTTNSGLTPFIHGGTIVRRGEYPWLTAIYKEKNMDFICGGSLVSSQIILTAAHCFQGLNLNADKIIAMLGRYNLTNYDEDNFVIHDIGDVILHPEYMPTLNFSDADLALLKVRMPVSFTRFIKPICLWSESDDESLIVNHIGVVAGWGSDENIYAISDVPKQVKTTIVSNTECLRSSPAYTAITSARTFCAGKRDGTGPCEGDSGGGLMLNRNGHWVLRGVISAGLTYQRRCDLKEYTVYCDVAKHMLWLDSYIGQQEQPSLGSIEAICGITEVHNEYPWLAALYRKLDTGLIFHCTGTLISSRTVLVPAHCVDLPNGEVLPAENLRIYLGRYDLNNMNENGVVKRDVETVIQHPKYKFTVKVFYDNDIALLQLKRPVSFTQRIRPICLWSEPSNELDLVGQTATLSSWDIFRVFDESLTVPQSTEVDIVPMEHCQSAGYDAGTTKRFLCTPRFSNNVDGILMQNRNGRWLLRGVSSSNLFYIFRYASRNFRVYSHIVDYLSWIQSTMLS